MSYELDPQVRDVLQEKAVKGHPPKPALSVGELRDRLGGHGDPPAVKAVRDLSIPGPGGAIPLRIYTPVGRGDEPLPVLVSLHGGGWVRGDIDTFDDRCRLLTDRTGCLVVSVDYRRAPEHPFPAAVEDCYAATRWAAENAEYLGGDPDRLAISGGSAGGTLSTVVSLMARRRGSPSIDHQILVCPVTDYDFTGGSYGRFDTSFFESVCPAGTGGYPLSREGMEWYWDRYLSSEIDGRHPYVSPLQARDLGGLPPALVIGCELDPLHDEGQAYAERLEKAGVEVTWRSYESCIHEALFMHDEVDQAEASLDLIASELERILGR